MLSYLKRDIFKKRKCLILLDFFEEHKKQFEKLDIEKQCEMLLIILAWKASKKQSFDLTIMGGGKQEGTLRCARTLISERGAMKEVLLIEQSVTGLWSKTTDLLTV